MLTSPWEGLSCCRGGFSSTLWENPGNEILNVAALSKPGPLQARQLRLGENPGLPGTAASLSFEFCSDSSKHDTFFWLLGIQKTPLYDTAMSAQTHTHDQLSVRGGYAGLFCVSLGGLGESPGDTEVPSLCACREVPLADRVSSPASRSWSRRGCGAD